VGAPHAGVVQFQVGARLSSAAEACHSAGPNDNAKIKKSLQYFMNILLMFKLGDIQGSRNGSILLAK